MLFQNTYNKMAGLDVGQEEIELQPLDNDDNDDDYENLEWDDHEEETDFGGHDDSSMFHHFNTTIEYPMSSKDFILSVYDDANLDIISYGENDKGYWVSLNKTNSVKFYITEDGVQGKVGDTILKALGEKNIGRLRRLMENVKRLEIEKKRLEVEVKEHEKLKEKKKLKLKD